MMSSCCWASCWSRVAISARVESSSCGMAGAETAVEKLIADRIGFVQGVERVGCGFACLA